MLQELKEYYQNYCESIRQEAEALRSKPMPETTEELFALFETTGNRLKYEEVYFQRRKYLVFFGLKAVLDRDERDIAKLEEILVNICDEECWALPAHVKRDVDENWRIRVDLFAAETAQTTSEIITLLGEVLSQEVRDRVREEVLRRVLRPFAQSKIPYQPWENVMTNWCAVCGGAVGCAAICLLQEEPETLTGILDRICDSLERYYLQGFTDDGTCVEGLGYFTYGMTYFTGFADMLYQFTEGKRDLFKIEKLKEIAAFQAKCYFESGRTVSFSDGYTEDVFQVGLTCYLAMKYPEAKIPAMKCAAGLLSDHCYRWMALYRNLIWTKLYIEKLESGKQQESEPAAGEAPCQIVLSDAQWSICQSRNGAGMAAKGGHNDEPHNHNDVGSFLYLHGRDMLLADLGCGEYTKEYFAKQRYEYLCCRSLGHNLPLIDGGEQHAGEAFRCSGFETDGQGRTAISFAEAYGNPELKSLVRTLDWNAENGSLRVEDVFECTDKLRSIKENLVTVWKPQIQGNTVRIAGEEKSCLITVEDPETDIHCVHAVYSDHYGISQDVWLLQWEAPVKESVRVCFKVEVL